MSEEKSGVTLETELNTVYMSIREFMVILEGFDLKKKRVSGLSPNGSPECLEANDTRRLEEIKSTAE